MQCARRYFLAVHRDDGAASAPSMRQEVAALRRHTGMFMPPAGIAPQAAE
jgi:hypothetical protein